MHDITSAMTRRSKVAVRSGIDALLLIDVINDLAFAGGRKVLPWAERLVQPLRTVCSKARRHGLPVIYANDNFGLWHGSRTDVLRHCTRKGSLGAIISARLAPSRDDYFVLKPRHSAFFSTPLRPLLDHLGVQRLVLAGMATNMCVVATAHDAKMHGFPIVVLSDCCAAETDFRSQRGAVAAPTVLRSDDLPQRRADVRASPTGCNSTAQR